MNLPTFTSLRASTGDHIVYQLVGFDALPLYVGMTTNLERRVKQHAVKTWFARVGSVWLDRFDTRALAREYERELIAVYDPPYNLVSSPTRDEKPLLSTQFPPNKAASKTVSMPPDLINQVVEDAREEGHNNFSTVIVRALREYFARKRAEQEAA